MQAITTIGLDIAKSVFQVHGVDAEGNVVIRRQLKRRYVLAFFQKVPPCLVGIEACASSHHWSRELQALGHTVRLIPPAYVKPYVKLVALQVPAADGSKPRIWSAEPAPRRCPRRLSRSPNSSSNRSRRRNRYRPAESQAKFLSSVGTGRNPLRNWRLNKCCGTHDGVV